ncbi:MAG: hypothetical protein H6Q61_1220 [Firmicutes bacterium]|nr:hypothetical protein [Bacillota bacterium]
MTEGVYPHRQANRACFGSICPDRGEKLPGLGIPDEKINIFSKVSMKK